LDYPTRRDWVGRYPPNVASVSKEIWEEEGYQLTIIEIGAKYK
jgi:hypothetical protein